MTLLLVRSSFVFPKSVRGLSLLRLRRASIPLRSPSDNHANDTSGQNDLEIVAVLLDRHEQRKDESDKKSEKYAKGHGIDLACKKTGGNPGNQSFERGAKNNSYNHSAHRRREPCRRAVDCTEHRPQNQSQQDFIHGKFLHPVEVVLLRGRRIFSCSIGLYNGKANFFKFSGEKSRGPGIASLSRLLSTRWRPGAACKNAQAFPRHFQSRLKRVTHQESAIR